MLYYRFLSDFTFYIQHLRKDDKRLEYNYTDHEGNTVSSITNGGKERYWEFCLKYNKTFWDKFNFSISTAACKSMDEGIIEGDYVQYRNTSWSIMTQNILMLPKHGLQIYLSYALGSPGGMFTKERDRWDNSMYIEVSKRFKKGLQISLECCPISTKRQEYYNSSEYSYNMQWLTSIQYIKLQISYNFGKRRVRGANDADYTELENRLSR